MLSYTNDMVRLHVHTCVSFPTITINAYQCMYEDSVWKSVCIAFVLRLNQERRYYEYTIATHLYTRNVLRTYNIMYMYGSDYFSTVKNMIFLFISNQD